MSSVIERKTRGQVRFLRLPEVLAGAGLSRSTIYVRLKQGGFPHPVSLGSRAVGWVDAEVDEWMRERIVASRSNTAGRPGMGSHAELAAGRPSGPCQGSRLPRPKGPALIVGGTSAKLAGTAPLQRSSPTH